MNKALKFTLLGLFGFVALFAIGAVLIPILFRDQIVERLRQELNEQLDATVSFADVDVSLLSTFPTLTAEVVDLSVVGKGDFEGTRLIAAESVGAGLDIVALIFDREVVVESVSIERPEVRIVILEDGRANYDIVRTEPSPAEESDEELALELKRYDISDGSITYEELGVYVEVRGLEHEGRAKLAGSIHTLASETTVDALTVRLGGVPYLKKAKASVSTDGVLDTGGESLILRTIGVMVNQLALEGSGNVAWGGDGTDLDLQLASKKGLPIKALISAIPNAYAADFAGLKGTGTFSVSGAIKGQLGPEDDDIPSFSAKINVRDGAFKYPDLPLGVSDLHVDANVEHPGGNLDKLRANVPRYSVAAGKSHARGRLTLTRPLSGPHLELELDGRFDAAEISKAYPLPDFENLAGLVVAVVDLASKGERIEKLTGNITVTDLRFDQVGSSPVHIRKGRVELTPLATKLHEVDAQVGQSDLQVNGVVSPLTVILVGDAPVTASAWLKSRRLRVEDFLAADEQAEDQEALMFPENLDANLAFDIDKMTYGDVVLDNFKGNGRLKNRKLTLNGVRADALGGSMKLDGSIATPVKGPPTFDITYGVDRARFKDAFESLHTMQAFVPIARFLDGRFSADLSASGTLDETLSPRLESIDASGLAAALQSTLKSDFPPLATLNQALPSVPKPLDLDGVRARFEIEDGTMKLNPTTIRARGITMEVSGKHGLDQEMKYQLASDVPIDQLPPKLAQQARALRVDLSKAKTVGVRANLTGSIKQPRVSLEVDTKALRGAIADAASAELAEQRAKAMQEAQKQARRIVEEAEKRAAQIRAEGAKAAEKLRKEGYARATQVEREGSGNPLKAVAAKEGAKRIRKETDKRADQLAAEANKRADQLVAEANKRAEQALSEADKRSAQGTGAIEGQTDKIR